MLEKYWVIYQKSMLLDIETNKECFTFYMKDGIFCNGLKNAKFFTDINEANKVYLEHKEAEKNGYMKTYIKEIQISIEENNSFNWQYPHKNQMPEKFKPVLCVSENGIYCIGYLKSDLVWKVNETSETFECKKWCQIL